MVSLNGALEISSKLAAGASARVFVSSGLSVWTASSTHDRSSSTPATSAKSKKNCVAESASLEEPGSEPLQATAVKAIAVAPTRVRVARRFIPELLQPGVRGQVHGRTPIGNACLSGPLDTAHKQHFDRRPNDADRPYRERRNPGPGAERQFGAQRIDTCRAANAALPTGRTDFRKRPTTSYRCARTTLSGSPISDASANTASVLVPSWVR